MKKFAIAILTALSFGAFAGDSATLEFQGINNVGAARQSQNGLTVKHEFNSMFAGDVSFTNAQTQGTSALSTRLEGGLTASAPVGFGVTGYVRGGMGQKFTNTGDFSYYSIEPGVSAPVGPVVLKAGLRYRSAIDSNVNNDQTHTQRVSVAYPLTKNDTVAVGYDRVRGDSTQNVSKISYTRGF